MLVACRKKKQWSPCCQKQLDDRQGRSCLLCKRNLPKILTFFSALSPCFPIVENSSVFVVYFSAIYQSSGYILFYTCVLYVYDHTLQDWRLKNLKGFNISMNTLGVLSDALWCLEVTKLHKIFFFKNCLSFLSPTVFIGGA